MNTIKEEKNNEYDANMFNAPFQNSNSKCVRNFDLEILLPKSMFSSYQITNVVRVVLVVIKCY